MTAKNSVNINRKKIFFEFISNNSLSAGYDLYKSFFNHDLSKNDRNFLTALGRDILVAAIEEDDYNVINSIKDDSKDEEFKNKEGIRIAQASLARDVAHELLPNSTKGIRGASILCKSTLGSYLYADEKKIPAEIFTLQEKGISFLNKAAPILAAENLAKRNAEEHEYPYHAIYYMTELYDTCLQFYYCTNEDSSNDPELVRKATESLVPLLKAVEKNVHLPRIIVSGLRSYEHSLVNGRGEISTLHDCKGAAEQGMNLFDLYINQKHYRKGEFVGQMQVAQDVFIDSERALADIIGQKTLTEKAIMLIDAFEDYETYVKTEENGFSPDNISVQMQFSYSSQLANSPTIQNIPEALARIKNIGKKPYAYDATKSFKNFFELV